MIDYHFRKNDLVDLLKKKVIDCWKILKAMKKRIADFKQEFGNIYQISRGSKNGKVSTQLLNEEELESLGGVRFYQYNGKIKSESSENMLNYFMKK